MSHEAARRIFPAVENFDPTHVFAAVFVEHSNVKVPAGPVRGHGQARRRPLAANDADGADEEGDLTWELSSTHPFANAATAYEAIPGRHVRGKSVLTFKGPTPERALVAAPFKGRSHARLPDWRDGYIGSRWSVRRPVASRLPLTPDRPPPRTRRPYLGLFGVVDAEPVLGSYPEQKRLSVRMVPGERLRDRVALLLAEIASGDRAHGGVVGCLGRGQRSFDSDMR